MLRGTLICLPRTIIWLVLSALISRCEADNGWDGQIFSFYWENDAIAGADRHYTQGAGISYLSRDDALPRWLTSISAHVPGGDLEVAAQKFGVAFSQEIYTPEDLHKPHLVEDDRPYAGWLYSVLSLQRRGTGIAGLEAIEVFRLHLGVIGPESLAEETQKTWHGTEPAGWQFQLQTEPGFILGYDRRYRIGFRNSLRTWGIDFIPYLGLEGGNVSTLGKIGLGTRFGYRIPNEFEANPTADGYNYGFYFSGGVEGRYVARNIFLDGNTFKHSHSVDRRPFVGNYNVGLTFVLKRFEIDLRHTFFTPDFKEQNTSDSVGRASLIFKF